MPKYCIIEIVGMKEGGDMARIKKIIVIILTFLLMCMNTIALAESDVSEIDYETAKIMFNYMMSGSSTQDQSTRANKLIELCNRDVEQLKKLGKDYGDVTTRMTQLFNEKNEPWWVAFCEQNKITKVPGPYIWNRRYFINYK